MKYLAGLTLLLLYYPLYAQHYDFVDTDFSKEDSIAINYKFEGNLDPVRIANDLTKGLNTDAAKFRVIFRWIAENIEYDVKLYLKTVSHDYDPKRLPGRYARWKKRLNKLYVKHTIEQRMTICEGYAWLLETMCRTVGIGCESIHGYARTEDYAVGETFKPNHVWNAVKINNKWYLNDPTWASGTVNPQLTHYTKGFNSAYFLVDPEAFIANHYPVDKSWMLLLNKPSLPEFFNAPIKTSAYLRNRIAHYAPLNGKNVIKSDSLFKFSFSTNRDLTSVSGDAVLFKNKNYTSKSFELTPIQNKDGYYSISHSFKEKGEYDLNIYINRRLTFIYKVIVK